MGSLAGRVIWINGPFGIGKSTVAELSVARLEAQGWTVVSYDPEQLGQRLRAAGRTPANYHDSALWREGVCSDVRERAREPVSVVVPQTIGRLEHFDEMIGGLREVVALDHFTLRASKEVHERRIANDPQHRGDWGLQWNPDVIATQLDPRFETFIDTDQLCAHQVVDVLAQQLLAQ